MVQRKHWRLGLHGQRRGPLGEQLHHLVAV